MTNDVNIQEVRFLVDHQGTLRKICKIKLAGGDYSFYLIPYAPNREYYYGRRTLPQQEIRDTFNFVTRSTQADLEPHLSIHESGVVQIYRDNLPRVGPLYIPRLTTLRGQHVATVAPDAFESLPLFAGKLRTGSRIDFVITAEATVDSGRLAIYINGLEPVFDGKRQVVFIRHRPQTYHDALYIGVRPISQLPLGVEVQEGITVIAGWDLQSKGITDYLYVRGR